MKIEAPKRRWFRWSLRRLLFWDLPCAAAIAALLGPVYRAPPPSPSIFDLERNIANAIGYAIAMNLAAVLAVVWLIAPTVLGLAGRVWGRWVRPRSNNPGTRRSSEASRL